MTESLLSENELPFRIARSLEVSGSNLTGTWRFMRPVYQNFTSPCSALCPAGEDIGRIRMHLFNQDIAAAWKTILMENPLPSVCGRVCFHPCESGCNRAAMDEAIAIRQTERFIGDTGYSKNAYSDMCDLPSNGKRVAIIGAGPAGLSAAYFLKRLGWDCEIFEKESEPGGLLRWGIPAYRLPSPVLRREIEGILATGISIHCGRSIQPDKIKNSGFDAVFFGCGHDRSFRPGITGDELAMDALDFLHNVRSGVTIDVKGEVAVIGGGNSAVDTARTLLRLGASPTIVYRRRRADMPAFGHEVESAVEEGVKILELLSPIGIEPTDEGVLLTLQEMKPVDITPEGRARVIPVDGKTHRLPFRKVFTAIGADSGTWQKSFSNSPERTLELSHSTMVAGDVPMVFGGDLTNSVLSVTDAIASGKQAAMALDILFQGGADRIAPVLDTHLVGNGPALSFESYIGGERRDRDKAIVTIDDINPAWFETADRLQPGSLPLNDRKNSFDEIERTFSRNEAKKEASRCFQCGTCNDCDNCRLFCPDYAVIVEKKEDGNEHRSVNLDYCKGCGICVAECPRHAMTLMEETE